MLNRYIFLSKAAVYTQLAPLSLCKSLSVSAALAFSLLAVLLNENSKP